MGWSICDVVEWLLFIQKVLKSLRILVVVKGPPGIFQHIWVIYFLEKHKLTLT